MINSFRRTGDGEADGSGGSCSGCSAVRAAAALFPRMASGEGSPPQHGHRRAEAKPHRSRISAAALLPMAIGEPKRSPTAAGASSSRSQQQG